VTGPPPQGGGIRDLVREGHFARREIGSPVRLIAWSHRRRFATALRLAREIGGRSLLDYGCGDGTFLAMLASEAPPGWSGVGAEREAGTVEECRARLGGLAGLSFVRNADLESGAHDGRYEAVFCMEVLEHVLSVDPVLVLFERLLAPSGRLVVSVPVEVGLPLLVKRAARRVAAWTGAYPPPTPYTLGELAASVLAGPSTAVPRVTYTGREGDPFHDHKGFNWMALRRVLARRFELRRTLCSPIGWLPPHLASQVWFVLGRRG
jgi:SAM-dependent methyltransferase